jgi:glutamine synthetase
VVIAVNIRVYHFFGVPIFFSSKTTVPGQLVVALGYQGPLKLADQIISTREAIVMVARSSDVATVFHRNPNLLYISFSDLGNGEGDEGCGLSKNGSHFLAGIVQHVNPLSVISGGPETRLMGWSPDREDAALKVRPDPFLQALTIQYDLGDSSFNPYITMAGILACGIDGIQNEISLSGSKQKEDEAVLSGQKAVASTCLASDDFLISILGQAIVKTHLASRNRVTDHIDD